MNEFRMHGTGQVVTEAEYRAMYPNTSFPAVLAPEDADAVLAAPPPPTSQYQTAVRDGVVQDKLGNWVHAYKVHDWTPEEVATYLDSQRPTQADFTKALEVMYDAKAQEKGYDGRVTCALRAGYPSAFQEEGLAFAIWMDGCNAHAYTIMKKVLMGQVAYPTVEELLAMMPALVWPE